ncbi:hypothetical protein BOW45_13015, partial [Solemya velum gill symbiont]|uniref:hypothetical protein n=1 Tax=Solemya velum gill symbiont TaxID=2340 RepID=UPI0009C82C32
NKWKDHITTLVHCYNCIPSQTTGYSPYQLMFGRKPKLPVDYQFDLHSAETGKSYTEFYNKLRDNIEYCRELAEQNARQMRETRKEHYDIRTIGATIEVGDHVLIRKVGIKGRQKLKDMWESDTYTVVEKPNVSLPVFKVQLLNKKGPIKTLHRNM